MSLYGKILRRTEGQGLVEYALIILLIAVAIVAALQAFGLSLSGTYGRIRDMLPF